MSDWIEYRIRELALDSPNAMATGPFGSSISSKFFEAEGVPVIRGGNLSADVTNRMSDNGLVFVSKSKAEEFKRSIVKEGDLVFTCWGTINQVGIITDDLRYKEYVISNKQMKLTVDPEKADPLFLYYLFSSPIKQAEIISSGIGAAVPGFNLGQLKEHVVTLPGVDEQVKISSVLDAFDTKIRLNLQTNQTLEQIAQAIFKSWFVDFEPTRAKIAARERWLALHEVVETSSPACYSAEFDNANQPTQALEEAMTQAAMAAISGKTPEELEQLSPEQQQNLRKIATLFPDTLVDSELGEIPEGWEVRDVQSVAKEIRRGISPSYTDNCGIGVINQKCIRNHSIDFELARLNDPEIRKVDGRLVEVGDVLVNSTGVGTLGRLAPVRYLPEPMVCDSHVTVVRADTNAISKLYLASLLLTHEAFIEASGAGSTGQTELRKEVIQGIMFSKPSAPLLEKFDSILGPLSDQIATLEQQQISLAKLRDTLLPKLLSGELSLISTAEDEVSC